VDVLLQVATATAAEQSTRERDADARDEHQALITALRDTSTPTYPFISALAEDLVSGTPTERLTWTFHLLVTGILHTVRPNQRDRYPSCPHTTPSPSSEPASAGSPWPASCT
jgi:Flp pilus assembly protein TadG